MPSGKRETKSRSKNGQPVAVEPHAGAAVGLPPPGSRLTQFPDALRPITGALRVVGGAVTTYNPEQYCRQCYSQLHSSCGLGEQEPSDDELEIAKLKAERDEARNALSVALKTPGWLKVFESAKWAGHVMYEAAVYRKVLEEIVDDLRDRPDQCPWLEPIIKPTLARFPKGTP